MILRLLCSLVLACTGFSQSGSFSIPSNTYLHHNLGPGLGTYQVPPPGGGVTRLYVEVALAKDYSFAWEISPLALQDTIDGYFKSTLTRIDSWQLAIGLAPELSTILTGGRMYPQAMVLEHTYPVTVWDGVLDWSGPTCLEVVQSLAAPPRGALFTLNALDNPPRDLWLSIKPEGGGVSTYMSNGTVNLLLQDPWRAVVTYEYLP